MALEAPRAAEMFSDASGPAEIAERMEFFKGALNKSLSNPQPVPQPGMVQEDSPAVALEKALGDANVAKALSPELVDSVRTALASGEVNKDWTTSNPLSSGLVAFDLEAPAKILVPRSTPLRNRIARRKGIGLAHRFKRINGITGSQTGGVADMWPGITETTTNTFGSVNYLRGAKITYAGDDVAVNYKQFGVSDQVSWASQFAGAGFDDIRQLSQTALLMSSMQLEEKVLLGGRGTDSGYAGAVVPTISLAARAAGSGETALTGVTTNIYVKVVGNYLWGHSVLSAAANVAPSTQVVDVTVTNAESSGALSYDVYVGTGGSDPGDAARWRMVTGNTSSKITLQGALATSGTAASTITTDTAAYATGYDGLLTYATGPNAGYVKHLNNTFAGADGTNVGNCFGTAFASMYDANKADPDEIFANGSDRKQLSDQLKTQGSSGFRISLSNDESHGARIGSIVNGIYNPVTGKAVDLTVHPWLPQGTMPIISWTLPIPDSNVSDVFAVYNVTDYQGINWPVNQFAYEVSSYWYGTLVCYAPGWCGAIMGITKG
jgi:hypothetical protein